MPDTTDEQKQEAPRPPEWLMNSMVVIVAVQVVILAWTIWRYDLRLWG